MSIFDPFGIYPNIARVNMNIINSEGINIIWGENPDFSPSDFTQFLPEFIGLVEDGIVVEQTYNDTTAMIADQANQTIGNGYKAGEVVYRLDAKTGDISDYSVTTEKGKFNALFNVYATLASSELSEKRYNEVWTYVMSLYIAHKLSIRFIAATQTEGVTDAIKQARIVANLSPFTIASESVGGVSVSFETGATIKQGMDGGDWNRTQYGQELLDFFSAYGIGAWIAGI